MHSIKFLYWIRKPESLILDKKTKKSYFKIYGGLQVCPMSAHVQYVCPMLFAVKYRISSDMFFTTSWHVRPIKTSSKISKFWFFKLLSLKNIRLGDQLGFIDFINLVGLTMTWFSENKYKLHMWFHVQLTQKVLNCIYQPTATSLCEHKPSFAANGNLTIVSWSKLSNIYES